MSWRYLQDIWGQAKSGRAESEQTMSGQVQTGQVGTGHVRTGPVKTCRLQTKVNMHLRMEFDSGVGPTCV